MSARARELSAAIAAVSAGLNVALQRTGASDVTFKAGVDVVTAAEDPIRAVLAEHYPDIPVVGEERGGDRSGDASSYWPIDPICGTRNHASQLSLFCTNLALVKRGVTQLGAVGDDTVQSFSG